MKMQQANTQFSVKYKDRTWAVLKGKPQDHLYYTKKDHKTFDIFFQFIGIDGAIKLLTATEDFILIWTETVIWTLVGELTNDLEPGTLRIFAYNERLFANIINIVQEIQYENRQEQKNGK